MSGKAQTVRVGTRTIRLTNLDKVLYPATGTTKGEVIEYYTRVAPVMLPHLRDRPVTRIRWPEGVEEPAFFAKELEAGAPSWLRRRGIAHSRGPKMYPLVDDLAGLVYLAQVASLELHTPQWRFLHEDADGDERPRQADRLVLDFDPGPGVGLAECAEVARWARAVLDGMGMPPLPVTSGSKGIHLYAALPDGVTTDDAGALARELARALEADHPDLVVSDMAKSRREGRVLLDWSQNNGAKTTIAPYSLRGRERPTVAAPRTWQELDEPELAHLDFSEVMRRVDAGGDLLLGLLPSRPADVGGDLTTYIAKRNPGRTPEPLPSATPVIPSPELDRFVIQEHHASRLHWDLRLERGGVLVSWAVPRGIPATSTKNALAVMTEDHPIDYLDFAGEIPRGEYGAGTMTIWDTGRYELEKWRDDEVIFTAEGRPGGPLGRVRFALIRTAGVGEKSTWLLHRMKADAAGRPQPDARVEARNDAGPPDPLPTWGALRPMLAVAASAAQARERASRRGAWAEAKWDGIRALIRWDGAHVTVRGRSGRDMTTIYPELQAGLGGAPVILDGEIVALDNRHRPSFSRLQQRMNLTSPAEIAAAGARIGVHFFAFDVLAADGLDLTSAPLRERRGVLERVLAEAGPTFVLTPVFDDVDAALAASRATELEGIVVKDPDSPYRSGARDDAWLKVVFTRRQEVIIGGIRPGRAHRPGGIGSLLVGIPDQHGLRYVGRVGSGFDDAALRGLSRLLTPLRTSAVPFHDVPPADAADALWVRPVVVGEVEFARFTPDGVLRHARWRGLRPDRDPLDVQVEGDPSG
ncbi:ATP-dependent DNA ligase [Microbacterium aurantiacum]|uniref:ATP-dependent DNA ligase n=1 Tax=Microbacterium aurantiacum TaxID=162393 RepID=UPI003F495CF4